MINKQTNTMENPTKKEANRTLLFEDMFKRVFKYEQWPLEFVIELKQTGERFREDFYVNEMGVNIYM